MKKKTSLALTALALAAAVLTSLVNTPAGAVPIEGQTPEGGYQSVGVTDSGQLLVQNDTATAQNITISAPLPLPVLLATTTAAGLKLNPVTIVASVPLSVTGSLISSATICATPVAGQANVTTSAGVIFPADAARCAGVPCNADPTATVWVGPVGVTASTGFALLAGKCVPSPAPSIFSGALYGVSSATISGAITYLYYRP